jgi:hypothetical protein
MSNPHPNKPSVFSGKKPAHRKVTHTVRSAPIKVKGSDTYTRTTVTISPYPRGLAIKMCCTECLGFEADPRSECTSPLCPLYPYRGKTLRAYAKKENK